MTSTPKRYSKTGTSKRAAMAARPPEAKPIGRPPEITREMLDEVLRRIASGETLEKVCSDPAMPHASTVRERARSEQSFSLDLARARESWADAQADKIIEIADDSSKDWMEHTYAGKTSLRPDREAIDRSKARIDVRKWLMQRFAKRVYSDDATKLDPAHPGDAAELIKGDATVIAPDEKGPKDPVL